MTKAAKGATGADTDKNVKDMSAEERILLLRVIDRRQDEEGKRLQGHVSEAKTDFKNTLKAEIPKDGEEAKARLRQLQALDEKITGAKDRKSGFKQRCKTTRHGLLHSEVTGTGQMMLPGAELALDREQLTELRLGVADVKVQDQRVRDGGDEEKAKAKFPVEDPRALAAADAMLLKFIDKAGITSASLGAAPTKDEAKAEAAALH